MPDDLEPLYELVSRRCGSALSKQQRERVRLAAEASRGRRSIVEYTRHLEGPFGARELLELLAAVSVHKTDLFRDEQQLEALENHVLAPLALTRRPLSLWSAGCATGEEVATLLLLLARVGANPASTVLGTDLSASALERARQLTFSDESMRRVPSTLKDRYFKTSPAGFVLDERLARQARFEQHNLVETPYPLVEGGFDVIVCRNVLIYFTAEAADRTVTLLTERLSRKGTLVLSTAEPLLAPRLDLETLRIGGTFFYVPRGSVPESQAVPAAPRPRPSAPTPAPRSSSPTPAPRASSPTPLPRSSSPTPLPRASSPTPAPPTASAPRPSAPVAVTPTPGPGVAPAGQTPEQEGEALFSLVLEWAAAGQGDEETTAGLRKVLYLAPELAGARYCLGLLLEQRGLRADAITEYRRALAVLQSGKARTTAFYLNPDRLAWACKAALTRLGAAITSLA